MAYDYKNRKWEDELTAAQRRKNEAENAYNNYGQFNWAQQQDYDAAKDAYLNRDKFKFDMNNDALYKQYKDQYSALGKLAMQNTIGQASAMTGGYGNSYAATAGQQMYNNYMMQATDKIPELYGMALNRYNAEGTDLQNRYGVLADERSRAYSEYQNDLARLSAQRDYANNEYNNLYSAAYQAARDKIADEQYQQNLAYQRERDKVSDEQWQKSYDESVRQFNVQQQRSASSGGSSGGRRSSGSSSGGNNSKSKVTEKLVKEATKLFNKYADDDRTWEDFQDRYGLSDEEMAELFAKVEYDSGENWYYGRGMKAIR